MTEDEDKLALARARKFEEELVRHLPDDLAMEQIGISLAMKKRIREGLDPLGDESLKSRWLSLQFNAAYHHASHLAMEAAYGDDFPGYGDHNEEEPDQPGPFGRQ